MSIRKFTLVLTAASIMFAVPTSAMAATSTGNTTSRLVSNSRSVRAGSNTPTVSQKDSRCDRVTSVPGVTERCTEIERLPLADLSAGQLSERHQDMTKVNSKPQASPVAAAAITPPSACGFSTTGAVTAVSHPNRFLACSDTYLLAVSWEVTSTPPFFEVIGTFPWEDQQWASYSATSPKWAHGMVVMGYKVGATGNLADGVTGTVSSACHLPGICSATSTTVPDPQPVHVAPGGIYQFEWTEQDRGPSSTHANAVNVLDTHLGVDWVITNAEPPEEAADTGHLAGRCDTQVRRADGCVDEAFTPILSLSLARYGAAAEEIQWAQFNLSGAWGLQGVGQPLHRLVNPLLQRKNRRVICGNFVRNGAITAALAPYKDRDTCDEFPFASTYESGAMTTDVNGNAKPHVTNGNSCAQVTAVQTGTSGRNEAADWFTTQVNSVPSDAVPCVRGHVPGKLNSGVGNSYRALISTDRLINKDAFWLTVTP